MNGTGGPCIPLQSSSRKTEAATGLQWTSRSGTVTRCQMAGRLRELKTGGGDQTCICVHYLASNLCASHSLQTGH